MDASQTQPAEERPEDQPASDHPPTGESILNIEDHQQIEVDPPSGPAIVSRTSTRMYHD
jgi:hypothetical protein